MSELERLQNVTIKLTVHYVIMIQTKKCKITIYNIYFKNILLCGAERWTYSKREECKLQAVEMKFLRGKVNSVRRDRGRNTDFMGKSSKWRKYRTKLRGID
jgi:hypothetical protein